MYRVEDKYLLSPMDQWILHERLSAILPTDANTVESHDGYKISSVYFDDITDSHYRDVADGNPTRKKFRIRIYNDSFDVIKLEIKMKQYSRIKKLSKTITYDQMIALIRGEELRCGKEMDETVFLFNREIAERLLRPKIIVTYERKAFVCDAGNVRVTFDTHVRASDQIAQFGNQKLRYDPLPVEDCILEVKYDEFLPDYIAQTLEVNRMEQTSYSKYRLSRERMIRGGKIHEV